MTTPPLTSHRQARAGALVIPWVFLLTLILGLLLAYYMGTLAGRGNYTKIIAFIAVITGVTFCLWLKSKIWLLIPATYFLSGPVGGLNLPFGLNELTVMGVFGMFMVFYALKVPIHKPTFNRLDFFLILNLVYLVSVYARNPVGMRSLGSELVGGHPYFAVAIAVIAYWIFLHVILDPATMKIFPQLLCGGTFVVAMLGLVTRYIPGSASLIAPIYGGVNTDSYIKQNFGGTDVVSDSEMYRLNEFGNLGNFLNLYLCSMFRPITLLTPARIFPWLFFMLAWFGLLMSGFRGGIVKNALFFILASYFYSGSRDVVRSIFLMIVAVSLLLVVQGTVFNLPIPAQRALSFLPANWTSSVALDDAQGSANWRFHIWKQVWSGNKYIKNKLLGDGFGFTAADLAIQIGAMLGGPGYMGGDDAETQMITGAYHSGPLSAIRYVGVVGFILFMVLTIYAAQFSWKLINRAKGTPFFGIAIFVGLPLIYKPFEYVVIFGAFDSDLPFVIFQIGLLRLVGTSLEIWKPPVAPVVIPEPGKRALRRNLPMAPSMSR